jgi:hypothetical protein
MYKETLSWDVLEHNHGEKSADWYWSLGIIALTIALLCILFGNILLAIFVVLAAFTMGLHAHKEPKLITIELNSRGILVDSTLYAYSALESFWIEEHDNPPNIIIQSKKHLMPYVVLPINHLSPDDVRDYLLLHLKEVEHHESLGHKALEYLGF